MKPDAVTIVMPTWNAGPLLDEVFDAIEGQDTTRPRRIVAIDSGSTDGTIERLRRRGAHLLHVEPGRFDHGATRNEALSHADTPFAVLLVQDAVPASPQWLEALLHPLIESPGVAGSVARQLPAPGASRLAAHQLASWVAAQSGARISGPFTRGELERMPPAERHRASAFDNVCAAIRMDVWRSHPFRSTPIAEDLEWGLEVLRAGHALAYAPAAAVRHSHERSALYELQRTYLVHQRLHALFGLQTIPTVPSLVRAITATVPRHLRIAAGEPRGPVRAMVRGAALGIAWPLGQYLGARASRDGRGYLRTGRV